MPFDLVAVEREVHLFDPVALGAGAKRRLGARRAAAEQDALGWFHRAIIASRGDPGGVHVVSTQEDDP